ncbi:hypothetical protein BDZ91DRAFT_351433 [Kalaharituber pfeilii]|nr:hypothetical protein BDZ91DRAFT_351433 [Kalaharituber pfeilii]
MLMQNRCEQAGSSSLDLHPYATASASASASSLSLNIYEGISTSHHLPVHPIRPSYSTASLNPTFHNGVGEMMPLKPLYHGDNAHNASNSESRNGLLLTPTSNMGGEISHGGESNSAFEGHFPHYMLPEIASGVLQQDLLRQWTPLSTVPHRSSVYLEAESTNGQQFLSNSRMSPATLDIYSPHTPQNMFPALNNLSDHLPPTSGPVSVSSSSYLSKQPEKITLPTLQAFPRSQSLDMSAYGTRAGTSSTIYDSSLSLSGQYKQYSCTSEPSLTTTTPAYTFSPLKSRTVSGSSSANYSHDIASRASPPLLQPAPSLPSQPTISNARSASSFITGYSLSNLGQGYGTHSHQPLSLSASNTSFLPSNLSTVLNSPTTATSGPLMEVDKTTCRDASEFPKAPSSASTSPSIPASPYSSSPTSSVYGTSRSQPPTPVPSRASNDKGLNTHSSSQRRGQLNKIY